MKSKKTHILNRDKTVAAMVLHPPLDVLVKPEKKRKKMDQTRKKGKTNKKKNSEQTREAGRVLKPRATKHQL